jgi:ligand-binding sensor domain-containing protein/serine phosphatase RsbU (regulator of sigma subunit)
MQIGKRIISALLFNGLFFICSLSFSQNYHFRNFGPESGLSDNFIYNITQSPNGYLWLGTGEGISRFDGFSFTRDFPGDSLPSSPVRRSFTDSKNLLWFGFDNGSIAVLNGTKFKLIEPIDEQRNAIKGFAEDQQGNILVATQGKGILRIAPDFTITHITEGIEGQLITAISFTETGELFLGTFDGLFLYKYSASSNLLELTGRIEDVPYTNVQIIKQKPGTSDYFVGTDGDGLFQLSLMKSSQYSAKKVGVEFGLEYANIQDIYYDTEGNLWLSVEGDGIIKMISKNDVLVDYIAINESKGFPSRYVRNIYEDYEGNLWFATYGNGLSVLRNQFFGFYSFSHGNFNNNVSSVYSDDNEYWLGGEKGILIVDLSGEARLRQFLNVNNGLPNDMITALIRDEDGNTWIGTGKSGIYKINPNSYNAFKYFSSSNSLENTINSIQASKGKLYVATNGGLLIFDIKSGLVNKITTLEELPHNRIRYVFLDSKDNVWIATRSNGIYNLNTKKELTLEATSELEFVSIVEDKNGNLWAATNGEGVFLFSENNPQQFKAENGLRSNFCYSLVVDDNGLIWVGHSLGVSRINPVSGQVQVFSVEQGINAGFNINSVTKNSLNQIVFGTTQGLIIYDHTREKFDGSPPKLNISSLKINEQDIDFTEDIVLPYGRHRLRIDFVGISLRNPEKVTYQYKLDGYDEWSDFSSINYATFRIEDGEYRFLLRACNEEGICTPEEQLMVNIIVKIPFWKAWWFILSSILILIISVFVIIKLRERKQKQVQEYLEKLLDERTREVIAQKEEIENKSRDITDSINYAQRIQASILPPVKRLTDHFSGSFVFYQPKDIVSGDFYWYDRVWGNKFLIVCADSTGHGVPGAFMSMIGTTLIKDICARPEVRSPSSLLLTLDSEIKDALNQNKEAEKSNDGMDIIVAEIDLDTNELRVASAMRPLILYINGKQIYVKGSRNSVGGRMDEDTEKKEFTDERYILGRGDLVYMFSDGYPDQFGGPLGKKFKMVRLKNLLRDIHDKPMNEQYQYIKSNFLLWKEELEQVDDVLFMGIKL